MIDIKELLLQWLINLLIKKTSGSSIKIQGFYYVVIYNKYAWFISLKDKKCIIITNDFQNQTKYGLIKVVNFTIDQLNHG